MMICRFAPALTKSCFTLALLAGLVGAAYGQTDAPLIQSVETHYYDFWPGTWVQVIDGRVDTTATMFTVRRSVNPAAYEEHWRQEYDGEYHYSTALRGWDQVTNKWLFTWISDNGLFQVWDGQKIEGEWYIVKEFLIEGRPLVSRQAWVPDGDRVTRLMERSWDHGKTWELRSRTVFERVER